MGKTLDELYSTLYKQSQAREKQASSSAARTSQKTVSAKTTPAASSKKKESAAKKPTPSKTSSKSAAPGVSPEMDEEAIILADKDTNTLIINATPDQHRDIERTVRELDQARRQVLIETVLMEVTLDDSINLGIEWAIGGSGDSSFGVQSGLSPGIDDVVFPFMAVESGLSYLFDSDGEKMAFIQAAEDDDRLQVLASPTVLTRDGMEAEVSFGEEVPIQQKTTTDAGKDTFSYDYRDAKITLTVTPVIDDNKMVTLNLEQTLRQVDPAYKGEPNTAPVFTTRELRSNLQVENGQTLILGGLIQRKDQEIRRGIPVLCRLPLIGWLFGSTRTVQVGSEIMMILTPYVVDGREETDLLTQQFREKILGSMSKDDVRKLYGIEDESSIPVQEEGE